MKVIVLGSSGLVGGELVKLLVKEERVARVILYNRRPLDFNDSKIETRLTDFEKEPEREQVEADVLFCCLGTTMKKAKTRQAFKKVDHDIPLNFAKAFCSNPHQAFCLVSAMGSNHNSPIFYNRVKGELEEELKKLPLKSLIIVRPSLLLGSRGEKRFWEEAGQKVAPLASRFLPLHYRPVKALDVARTMLELGLYRKNSSIIQTEIVEA